jgi:hypothetical protein
MNWLRSILIGIGTMIAGIMGLVLLSKNETVGEALKQHHQNAMEAGREAAAEKRETLEQDLARMMLDEKKEKS